MTSSRYDGDFSLSHSDLTDSQKSMATPRCNSDEWFEMKIAKLRMIETQGAQYKAKLNVSTMSRVLYYRTGEKSRSGARLGGGHSAPRRAGSRDWQAKRMKMLDQDRARVPCAEDASELPQDTSMLASAVSDARRHSRESESSVWK
jgi:hypothetical protein